MWYSLHRWLQKLKDRKQWPWRFEFKEQDESPKALFLWIYCGEKDRKEIFIFFISSPSFKTSSCVSYWYVHLDSSMHCWLACYYLWENFTHCLLFQILSFSPGSEEIDFLQSLPHTTWFKHYNFTNILKKINCTNPSETPLSGISFFKLAMDTQTLKPV